jgi:gamma-glutamylcyclotransferase (GGCT)/AIG2-like uncharacterized protein YtfP
MGALDTPDRLFVYGTLMPGEPLWPELAPYALSWEPVVAEGSIWDTGHGYPAVRFLPGGDQVPGILVAVGPDRRDEVLALLDHIEGVGVLYRRVVVPTTGGDAFAYEWIGAIDGFVPLTGGWPPPPP